MPRITHTSSVALYVLLVALISSIILNSLATWSFCRGIHRDGYTSKSSRLDQEEDSEASVPVLSFFIRTTFDFCCAGASGGENNPFLDLYFISLPSIELFAPPKSEVVIVLDEEVPNDQQLAKKLKDDWIPRLARRAIELRIFFEAKPVFYESFPANQNHRSKGHDRAQWSYFYATNYTRAEIVAMMDADGLLRRPLFLSEWVDDKRRLKAYYTPYVRIFDAGSDFALSYNSSKMGTINGMSNIFPVMLRASTFARIRHAIAEIHSKSFDLAMVDILAKPTAQFSVLTLGAYLYDGNNYEIVDDHQWLAFSGHHIPTWHKVEPTIPMSFMWTEAWCQLVSGNPSRFCTVFHDRAFWNAFQVYPLWFGREEANLARAIRDTNRMRDTIRQSTEPSSVFLLPFKREDSFHCFPPTACNDFNLVASTSWKNNQTGDVITFSIFNHSLCQLSLSVDEEKHFCKVEFEIGLVQGPIFSFHCLASVGPSGTLKDSFNAFFSGVAYPPGKLQLTTERRSNDGQDKVIGYYDGLWSEAIMSTSKRDTGNNFAGCDFS